MIYNLAVSRSDFSSDDKFIDFIDRKRTTRATEMINLYNYYIGESDIKSRELANPNKVNNKLANDFFGTIIDDKVGYMGNSITLKLKGDYPDQVNEFITNWQRWNDLDDLNADTIKLASICGYSARLLYNTDKGARVLNVDEPWNVYVILDDNNVPEFALWFYNKIEFDGGEHTVRMCEVYDKESVYTYRKDGSWIKIDEIPHLFSGVPLFIIENNSERLGDFEKAVDLINAYDKALSDVSSEMEQLRLAYAILKGTRLNDEIVEQMKQTGILTVEENGSFEFVEKQLDSASIQLLLSEIRRNIFLFCKSVDFSEVLAGDIRVLGWQTKLMPLENKAKIAERKMISALRYQYDLLTQYWAQFDGVSIDVNDMNWIFTRNIPKDIEGEARALQMLFGVVDQETALSLMSFIDNPKEVIERMEAEMPPVNLDGVSNE